MKTLTLLINILIALGAAQDPCDNVTIQNLVENSDLVAVASLDRMNSDYLPDSIYVLNVHTVYKGVVEYKFVFTSSDYTFKEDTHYLVFGAMVERFQFVSNSCFAAVEWASASSEFIDFLEERWVSNCYSAELEEELSDKATSRELLPFCGCDGKDYHNLGHLRTKGITQYTPGECK